MNYLKGISLSSLAPTGTAQDVAKQLKCPKIRTFFLIFKI